MAAIKTFALEGTKLRHTINVTAAMVLIGLVSAATNLVAASVTANPPLVMNDYVGQVSLAISDLSLGKRVLIERFVDANLNGVIDVGEDGLTFSFKVTDGQVPLIGGVRNPNVPGDDDGATNGSIRVDLPFPNVDRVVGSAAVNFIFRVSDPQNAFSPVTATFNVQQRVQSQGVSGTITAAAGGAPLQRRFVLLAPPNTNPIAAVLTDTDGNYSFNSLPGAYEVFVVTNGFVSDRSAGAVTVIANQFATRNLALASAGFTISGKISDNSSGVAIAGILVVADDATSNLSAGALSDANGHYSFSVTAGRWRITPFESQLAEVGYLRGQRVTINTAANGTATIDFPVPKARALIYGTVKDGANTPVAGVRVEADEDNPSRADGFTFSPNANYATGVVAGTWFLGPDADDLAARLYTGGTGAQVTLDTGQAQQVNFVVQPITAHLRGQVRDDLGAPIPNIGLSVQLKPAPIGGNGLHPQTDSIGNFDAGVGAGTWGIDLECSPAQGRGYVNVGGLEFDVIDGVDQDNLVLTFPIATATITGSVRDNFGQPIAGVTLDTNQDPYHSGCIATDTSGNYTIKVVGGTWNVSVRDEELNARGFNSVASQDVTISGGTATADFIATPLPPEITSPLMATGTVGLPFVYQFETRFSASLAVPNPPPGLTFDLTFPPLHAIVGTPSAAGSFQVELDATNSTETTTRTLTIDIQPQPALGPFLVSGTGATGRAGQPFNLHVITTRGTPAARVSASGLPAGLSIDPVSGLISGIPAAEGSSAVTLEVIDGAFTTSSILQLTFTSDPAVPVITSPDRAALTPGADFLYQIVATSSADPSDPTVFSYVGTLPPDLSLDPATGIISGTYNPPMQKSANGGSSEPEIAGGVLLGNIQLFGTNSHGTSTFPLTLLPASSGLVNISTRLLVGTGSNVLIGGFIIQGSAPKVVLVRAIGPSTGIPGALQDPILELHNGPKFRIIDDWGTDQTQEQLIIYSGIPPTDDRESAILLGLDSGAYSAIVAGKDGATGIALVEAYDLFTGSLETSGTARLANISTRGFADTGDNVMIGGFIILGQDTRVIVRAIGPSLGASGIQGALQDTTLELRDIHGSLIRSNDDWRSDQEQEIIDTGIPPTDNRESAIVATLAQGAYSGIVGGKDGTSGVALVEVYWPK
jgi:protocatechuate 3,4-dioxygenase beta subunit